MLLNAFNHKNIANKITNEIINNIISNFQVPKYLSNVFNKDLLKNRLATYISWEIWSYILKDTKTCIKKKKVIDLESFKEFTFKKKLIKINCKNYFLNLSFINTCILFFIYFFNWFICLTVILKKILKKKNKSNLEIQLFYGIGYRDVISNEGKTFCNFLQDRFDGKNRITFVEINEKIDKKIIKYLKNKNIFIARNIFFLLFEFSSDKFILRFKVLLKHFFSIIKIYDLLKRENKPLLFLYRLSNYELINFVNQNLNIKTIYETMSDVSKIEIAIKNKKFENICLFYSCNHFTNQITKGAYEENYPEPVFRRFCQDQVLVWNDDERKYLEEKNNYKNINFLVTKPINWQPKVINHKYKKNQKILNVGIIFPIPISQKAYEDIGYYYYEENFENITNFINIVENNLDIVSRKMNFNYQLSTKLKRSFNTISDSRFDSFLKGKKIKIFEHKKNFYEFFSEVDFSFGFWKTSAAYISYEVSKPFYYYSPNQVYDYFYQSLKLRDNFGYCSSEIDLQKVISENFLRI